MKLPPLDYASPRSIDEVIRLLAEHEGEAKILSGGQSLLPVLAFRLATVDLLVDLRNVPDLDGITIDDAGIELGAKVRWRDIEVDRRIKQAHPLLAASISHIAHYQVRNRGTVGGSLAHADPAAELPAVAVTCEAEVRIVGPEGYHAVPATELFLQPLVTALEANELITSVIFPPWQAGRRYAFQEFARRRGDFALAGVVLFYDDGKAGRIENPHIGGFGIGDTPLRLRSAEDALMGQLPSDDTFEKAVAAAQEDIDPPTDIHADTDYRRAILGKLLGSALRHAAGQEFQ